MSGPHALFVGEEAGAAEALIQRAGLGVGIFQPRVHIEKLVTNLAEKPDDRFLMGAVFARIEGFGNSLRTISLWGADVADAEMFHRIRHNLAPYRVELRDVATGTQLLSISSRGEVVFIYDGPRALDAVDQTLKTLSKDGYVEWP